MRLSVDASVSQTTHARCAADALSGHGFSVQRLTDLFSGLETVWTRRIWSRRRSSSKPARTRFDPKRTFMVRNRSCASAEAHAIAPAHKKPFTEKRRAICRSAYAVAIGVQISVADTMFATASRRQCCKTCGNDAPAVRDETRGPVQTETAESLPRDRRGRFHRPHPTGTVPADVHAKFCTSVEKAVQTSIVTREAQKGCCLRGSRPFSGISQEIKSLDTSCETRTRNLQIRSLARCPLRQ